MVRNFLAILFIITAFVLFFAETRPYFNDISGLSAEKQKFDEALANSRELQTLRDQLLSKYNAIPQEDIEKLDKVLPFGADSSNLISMAESRASSHGVILKKMSVEEAEVSDSSSVSLRQAPPYKTINFSFTVSGTYASVLAFFVDLEQSLRLINVDVIGFSSGPVDVYEFNVVAQTYFASSVPISGAGLGGQDDVQKILTVLTKLRSVKIDTEFFQSDIFKSLVDFVPVLETPKDYGRVNPFAPVK
jgi:Tfp pilus assembly protein PilO